LLEVTDATGVVTRYEYNAEGERIAETVANDARTERQVDARGRTSRLVGPLDTVSYSYHPNGEVQTIQSNHGPAVTLVYDAGKQVVETRLSDGRAFQTLRD